MNPAEASADPIARSQTIRIYPVTADRWPDLEQLFGESGAYAGCWCMFWRLERSVFRQLKGDGVRSLLKQMVEQGQEPGLLAYIDDQPAGWCSLGPRQDFLGLENHAILRRVDDQPVWSVVCFFVRPENRQQGVAQLLLQAAIDYARAHGAQILEGYPIDMAAPCLSGQRLDSLKAYMGVVSLFSRMGFVEVGQPSEMQRIMRLRLN